MCNFDYEIQSIELALRKVHLRMGLHELLQLILLLKLVTRRETLLFLSHVKHHLLDCRPCLSVQIRQLWGFRVYLLSIDFDISLNGCAPPAGLVFPLFDVQVQVPAFVAIKISVLDGPVGFLSVDLVLPLSIDEGVPINNHHQLIDGDCNLQVLLCYGIIQKDEHFQILHTSSSTSNVCVQMYFSVRPPFPLGAG